MSDSTQTRIKRAADRSCRFDVVCDKNLEYVPYGYTAPPSKGGVCAECGCNTGSHERDCEICS